MGIYLMYHDFKEVFMLVKFFTILTFCTTFGAKAAPLIVTPGDLNSFRIDVDIKLDGTTKRFQLDTGANNSMVAPDSQFNQYSKVGTTRLEGAAGVAIECDLIAINEVIIDSLILTGHQFKRCDLGEHSFNNLGMDIFNNKIFELNFKTNELFFIDHVSSEWKLHPLTRLEKGHLKIDALIDNKPSHAVFDTGAQLTSIDSQFVEANPHLFKLILSEEAGRDITGKPVFMKFYEMSEIIIGNVSVKNITVAAFDFKKLREYFGLNTPVIFGTNAIIQFNWLINLQSSQWAVSL